MIHTFHNNERNYKHCISAVDLFCGAGGLTYGLSRAGIEVNLGIDVDPVCEYPYKANNNAEFWLKSVDDVKGNNIKKFYGNGFNLLAGCAPCQTFSTYNPKADVSDKRWDLIKQFSRLVVESTPDLVTMENVPGLLKHNVFKDFVGTLEGQGYFVHYEVVDCVKIGIPQKRKRLVLLASKLGHIKLHIESFTTTNIGTVEEAIGNLNPIEAGMTDPQDSLHHSASLSPKNLKRIRSSKPGGTWNDWDESLKASCHNKDSGSTYSSVYGRMHWNKPSPTITTQFYGYGNGRFGHPQQNRALSLREGAILQSFPTDYQFIQPNNQVNTRTLGKLIGNAVPPRLGELIGYSIVQHVSCITGVNEITMPHEI